MINEKEIEFTVKQYFNLTGRPFTVISLYLGICKLLTI